MASYLKRGKRWQALVRVARHPPQFKTFTLKRDAVAWATATETKLRNSVATTSAQGQQALHTPFHALLRRYKAEILPRKAPLTQQQQGFVINSLIFQDASGRYRYPLVALLTTELTREAVGSFIEQRLHVDKVKPQTLRNDIGILGHCFTVATKEWGLPAQANPFYLPVLPKKQATAPPQRITRELESLILETAKSCPYAAVFHPLIVVALHTGLRGIELLRLEWHDVDTTAQAIALPTQKTKNGKPRVVPLDSAALSALSSLARLSSYVFPMSRRQLTYAWSKLRQQAEIDTHFHWLRHEFISRCRDADIPSYYIMKLSGHSSEKMLNVYSHADDKLLRSYMDKLENRTA